MSPNRSHAVMSQRREPRDSLDDFPTQPWGTRALLRHVIPEARGVCWEPACNRGYMVRPLAERFATVHASDVHRYDRWPDAAVVHDFVGMAPPPPGFSGADWIISNPPFRLGLEFARRALDLGASVAMLGRAPFLESEVRYRELFLPRPPHLVGVFVERLPLVRGACDPEANSATMYCWFVWHADRPTATSGRPEVVFIPPCRADLERLPDDYPDWAAARAALRARADVDASNSRSGRGRTDAGLFP